ncbi:HIT family protein [Psychromarinibacter sp. S121]|uniref:HIT family protein n=1 Tax=Psychromarinibacter sp. S121 TaxID=3415127 RepID=UPI003C7BCEAF
MTCLFCGIACGDVPAAIVYEDDELVAFLDTMPIRRGHVQIIPRAHYPYFDDLPGDLAGRMLVLGQRLARAMKQVYGVQRVGFAFTGGDVDHAHAHVVPLHEKTDLTSRRYIAEERLTFTELPALTPDEAAAVVAELKHVLEAGE